MLARMHLAGRDFPMHQPNLRGLAWWNETVPVVLPFLDAGQAALIRGELAYQNHVAAGSDYAALPRGPVHADLFRDNVMFDEGRLTGFFDFYFAGDDTWLFDLAADPTERHDLAASRPDKVAELAAILRAHEQQMVLPSWPALIEGPIAVDHTLAEPLAPGDEYVYWAN